MKKLFMYLTFRQKSYLYFKLGRSDIPMTMIKYILAGVFSLSFLISIFLFYRLNTDVLSESSSVYLFFVLVAILLSSGLNTAMISSDKRQTENNDLNFLLTKPISPRLLLLVKLFERIILIELFLTVHIVIAIGMFLHSLGFHPFTSFILSLNFTVGLYLAKVSVFSLSFIKPVAFNMILFVLSFFKVLSAIVLILHLLLIESNILNDVSLAVAFQQYVGKIPIDHISAIITSERSIYITSLLLGMISVLVAFASKYISRDMFLPTFKKVKKRMYRTTDFSAGSQRWNIVKLIWLYMSRQKKQEIAITYIPLLSSVASIIVLTIILMFQIPDSIYQYTLIFYLFLASFTVKMVIDTYCFLSCVDFYGKRFFLFKLSGMTYPKLISSQIMFTSVFNFILAFLILIGFQAWIPLDWTNFGLLLVLSIIQIILFNLIYYLSSVAYPKFDTEQITLLPSFKAKVTANILISVSFAMELVFYLTTNDTFMFFALTILLNLFYCLLVYRLIIAKLPYIRLQLYSVQENGSE